MVTATAQWPQLTFFQYFLVQYFNTLNHVKGVARTKWGQLYSEPHKIMHVITDTCVETS
jgi:hypothetical protein